MEKPGRNDPCLCGSGKKFKKCCESKMVAGKFKAEKIETAGSFAAASKISSFFKSHLPPAIAPTPPSFEAPLEEKGEQS
jgi:hypothetical protein